MGKMWEANSLFAVVPYGFKKALGKVNEDFQGRRQHDSHEFLNILLGTLHEEVNVRIKKPYVENPENCKDTPELIHQFWSNYLRRNWSFFVFIYHGQIRSSLECQKCRNVKVLYEPFSNISLPVPGSNSILLPILVNCLPLEVQEILNLMV